MPARHRWIDDKLAAVAAGQHALVARRQVEEMGFPEWAIEHRVRAGRLVPVTSEVLRIPGAPRTADQHLLVPVLHLGGDAVLGDESAAALWGVPGFNRWDRVTVRSSLGASHSLPGVIVRRTGLIADRHRLRYHAIPVLSPSAMLFWLASQVPLARAARALDWAAGRQLVTYARMHRVLDDLGGRGRPGTTAVRSLLAERPASMVPPASGVESRFFEIVGNRYGPYRRQVDCGDDHEWIGRVDCVFDRHGVIVEVNSVEYHWAVLYRNADRERYARLEAAGYEVVPCWSDEIFRQPQSVLERLDATFRRRAA